MMKWLTRLFKKEEAVPPSLKIGDAIIWEGKEDRIVGYQTHQEMMEELGKAVGIRQVKIGGGPLSKQIRALKVGGKVKTEKRITGTTYYLKRYGIKLKGKAVKGGFIYTRVA